MRIILNNHIISRLQFEDKPYSKVLARIYLLTKAAPRQKVEIFRGHSYLLQKGQIVTSDKKLCNEWEWSRNKERAFIEELIHESFISIIRDNCKTIITISNYDSYVIHETTESTTVLQDKELQKAQVKEQLNALATKNLDKIEVQEKEQVTERAKNNCIVQGCLFPDIPDAKSEN